MPQQIPQGHQAVSSWDDIIRKLAEQEGVNPALALAVAKRESGMDPNAIGDGGKAVGFFQLHDGAALDTNVNKQDPVENILGGVRYLKQLQTRYADPNGHADLSKVLMAYNGGMGNVDKGTVSPDAQKYAFDVIGRLTGGDAAKMTPQAPPVPDTNQDLTGAVNRIAQGGTGSATGIQAAPGWLESARRMLVGTGRQIAESYDPRTTEGKINIGGTLGGIAATYATGGASVAIGAKVIPWIQRSGMLNSISRVLAPAIGAATGGGTAAAGSALAEGRIPTQREVVGAAAEQGLTEAGGGLLMGGARRVLKAIPSGVATRVGRQAKETIENQITALGDTGRNLKDAIKEGTSRGRLTTPRPRMVSETLADSPVAAAETAYQTLTHPPSVLDLEDSIRNVLGGQPGIKGEPGAATRALQETGQRVKLTAEAGPVLAVSAVRQRAHELAKNSFPTSVVGQPSEQALMVKGQIDELQQLMLPGDNATSRALQGEVQSFSEQLAQMEQRVPPPLPGLLGLMQSMPDEISFADAHKLKTLLDESVNWDTVSKKQLQQITKGVRNTLRGVMQSPEYNAATKAYEQQVQLYRKGRGRDIINAVVNQRGGKLPDMLNGENPVAAAQVRELLVGQSIKGGDEAGGQSAWNQLRDHYTHNKIIKGGINGLGDRLRALTEEHPEFVRAVYGDELGQQQIKNLGQVVNAIELAQEAMKGELRAAQQGVRAVQGEGKDLMESSLRPFIQQYGATNEIVDLTRFIGFGSTRTGFLSAARLLFENPRNEDIIRYAAKSNATTQKFVRALFSPNGERVLASMIRTATGGHTAPQQKAEPK